jgi:hypothetical protein
VTTEVKTIHANFDTFKADALTRFASLTQQIADLQGSADAEDLTALQAELDSFRDDVASASLTNTPTDTPTNA